MSTLVEYLKKKVPEKVLKAYIGRQLNNTQESSRWFLGKLSADRNKITDPEGAIYDLQYTGNPREYELACRLSNTLAVVNATEAESFQVGGNKPVPVLLLTGPTFNSFYLQVDTKVLSLDSLVASVSIDSSNKVEEFIYPTLSQDGKDLLIYRTITSLEQNSTLTTDILSYENGNVTPTGITCETSSCELVNITRIVYHHNFFTNMQVTTYRYSALVFKNINITNEGSFKYSDIIEIATNQSPYTTDNLTLDSNTYGIFGNGDLLNYTAYPNTSQNSFGGGSGINNRMELFFDKEGIEDYKLLFCKIDSFFGPYYGWASGISYSQVIPDGTYCGKLFGGVWSGCSTPFPTENTLVAIQNDEYGTRTRSVAVVPLMGTWNWNDSFLYGAIAVSGTPSQGVINDYFPASIYKNSFGAFTDQESTIPAGYKYSTFFVDENSYLFKVLLTNNNQVSQNVWPVTNNTSSFNGNHPSEEISLISTKDSKSFIMTPYGNFSYNDFGLENLSMILPHKGKGFLAMRTTSVVSNVYSFDIYRFRLNKDEGTLSPKQLAATGSFDSSGFRYPYELRLRS